MKTVFAATSGILLLGLSPAGAGESPLSFGGERIGVPPLSLSESVRNRASAPHRFQFETGIPSATEGRETPGLTPNLIPRTVPNIMRKTPSPSAHSPRVSRASGMPILVPSDAVDYKMTIVPPDPTVDFKIVIKDPGPVTEQETASEK